EGGVVGEGMFGGRREIGDNEGLYIGKRKKLEGGVFIGGELGGKGLEDIVREFDRLWVIFGGERGKGK
uniref:hypothetical protein n=1 Tax=Bacillus thuringiensis TaxID=1428 RepID=UPI001C930CCF